MHVVRFADAPQYEAQNHIDVVARRIQGREAGGARSVYVSISEYPPGAGGHSTIGESEVIYVVLEGRMRVTSGAEELDLETGDSVSFVAGEQRSAHNVTSDPARLLVIHESV